MAFLSLQDAKDQLDIKTSTQFDAELPDFIDAACDEVESWCGAVELRTVTDEFVDLMGRTIFNELTTAGTRDFVVRWRPVVSITAVSSAITAGATYTPTDFFADPGTGIIRRFDGGTIFGPLLVSYTAGYATPPGWARMAAKIIVQHLWRTQRGGAGRGGPSSTGGNTTPGYGFAVPNMAVELMESHRNVPGIG
jgi:hypothetical protein